MGWKPESVPGVELRALQLSPMQEYVAASLDGKTDLEGLAELTGLTAERVAVVLDELVAVGAVRPRPASLGGDAELRFEDRPTPMPAAEGEWVEHQRPDPSEAADSGATHRALYENALRGKPTDERAALARLAQEPELSALCFDPVPAVVKALFENPRAGLVHARLIARHHQNPAGLEMVAARAAFSADSGVRRALLHHRLLPASLFRRLWGTRRLLEQHHISVSREVPEQTKRTARETLRARFAIAPAEERVELIVKTEGRCLAVVSGLPVDSKTTALLCGRVWASTFMVQNVARWNAAPPQLIAHLLRQELVRRSPHLRLLLQRHPNAPSR